MKYVSIDLETSGLNPEKHQILEFGAIVEDTNNRLAYQDLPKYRRVIWWSEITGQPMALEMHAALIREIASMEGPKYTLNNLVGTFYKFLLDSGFSSQRDRISFTAAGKNFANFDQRFLNLVPKWDERFGIVKRVIDPAILWWIPETDEVLPSLTECAKRANVTVDNLHSALNDCWTVIKLIREYHDRQYRLSRTV